MPLLRNESTNKEWHWHKCRTFWDQNYRREGPHPRGIYNCSQQLYLDAKIVLQTTYAIVEGIELICWIVRDAEVNDKEINIKSIVYHLVWFIADTCMARLFQDRSFHPSTKPS